jgi:hypothetical protein
VLKLLQRQTRERECHAKAAFMAADHFQQQLIRRQVTFGGNLADDFGILVIVEIVAVGVEDAVSAESKWLVNLEVKTDRSHGRTS